ncbi:SDR family oxidoreductase [Winogradskya consettensis]|uniref:Oxidoreductase n=1 Tax=Winogradskya consettensis TaxID=113560 RepID=A0A919W0N4_9ACTN|nr:SDR family oxidoreductase [Actinoplanes consettensis]GIM82005.1 oxidoreductase [Actinoplanes consettensis]
MSKFAGKKAVVSGGTHGMGLAVVKALLDGGAEVLLTGRAGANLEAARKELGDNAHVVACDVSNLADIRALADTVKQTLGEVDLVHVNAGYAKLFPASLVTEEMYDQTFDINTKGAFFTAQLLAPLVRKGGGIVFTTSIANTTGTAGMSVYAGAKAAVRSFVKVLAAELLPGGIRVNAVSPGFIDTPSMGVDASTEEREQFHKLGDELTPMKRHGTPEEVAAAVLFLGFDATFTTGEELVVDGGLVVIG